MSARRHFELIVLCPSLALETARRLRGPTLISGRGWGTPIEVTEALEIDGSFGSSLEKKKYVWRSGARSWRIQVESLIWVGDFETA
jgi:hypothetical protein